MALAEFLSLPWLQRFIDELPGDPEPRNFVRQVRGALYSEVRPTPVHSPQLLAWSSALGEDLGIELSARGTPNFVTATEILSGNRLLPGMRPYAARYGGHQFGHWAGQLGDGRAITLGEAETPLGGRQEFQLKGSGLTPYSRTADGRAVLRSSLREYLCSEAMHALGVPTTRALSLVTTGEDVIRDMFYDGHPRPEPGAIVCRVSPSFLRIGNFEILADAGETVLLQRLTDHVIRAHYPALDLRDPDVYGLFLDEVCRRTAELMTHWMRVGFIHGVMNTDNFSILGLTIDYGPYGWLEPVDPGWTPNTTDAQGRRYCYENQPGIGNWNVARLCEALYPLIPSEERLQRSLSLYQETYRGRAARMHAEKLGLPEITDTKLAQELFHLLHATQSDYTLFFRVLADWDPEAPQATEAFLRLVRETAYSSRIPPEWRNWSEAYTAALRAAGVNHSARNALMKRVNPRFVPRNYLAQQAIQAAEVGDTSILSRLMQVLRHPYDDQPENADLASLRPNWAATAPGCAALSCSS